MKCCDIGAGDLRHKIDIAKEVLTPDGGGGHERTYKEYLSLWAKIKPVSARLPQQGEKLEHMITHDIVIRWNKVTADVATSDIVVYNNRQMKIDGIINIEERNEWLQLRCIEGGLT